MGRRRRSWTCTSSTTCRTTSQRCCWLTWISGGRIACTGGGGGSARCSGLSISRFNLEPVAMSLFSTVRSSEADQDQTPNTMFFTATTSSNRCPVFSPLSFRLRPFYSPVLGGTTHSGRQGKNFAGPSKGRHSRFPPPPPPDSRGLPVHGTAGHRGGYHGHLQLRFDRDAKGNG